MPRGRHRHSAPLHRILTPAAVAVAALACAGAVWGVGEPGFGDPDTVVLRCCAAVAALAGVTGAVLLRRWDQAAGRRVGELKARYAGAEWRHEERQAELEGERDEAREARDEASAALREKRAELTRLRNEYAGLLRRYAHSETERASALEGRRRLELEASAPVPALTASATDHRRASGAPTPLTYLRAQEALRHLSRNAVRQRERALALEREQERERVARERERREREAREWREEQQRQDRLRRERAAQPRVPEPKSAPGGPRSGAGQEPGDSGRGSGGPGGSGGFDFFAGGNRPRRRSSRRSLP